MTATDAKPAPPPRLTLGDFELTILSDGSYYADGGAFFGVVPKTMWERKWPADAQNRIRPALNSLLVRTGEHTVLIETGAGNKLSEKLQRIYEHQPQLMQGLAAAGVAPDDIDIVINTHLHFDHCGWNTVLRDGKPAATFPRAAYYVQQGELDRAHEQHERDRVSYISANYDPLVENGRMRLLTGDHQIVPGISVRVLPGHTRHMQAVIVESGGRRACYVSDLIPTTHHLKPTWTLGYDLYPLETIANRHRIYAEAIPQRWLMVFTHDPTTPWVYLEADDAGGLVARAATP